MIAAPVPPQAAGLPSGPSDCRPAITAGSTLWHDSMALRAQNVQALAASHRRGSMLIRESGDA